MIDKIVNFDFLESIVSIAFKAGKAVMKIYKEDFIVSEKMPNHPITKADIESHIIIRNSLINLMPNTPFFSEESIAVSWDKRKQWETYWLVDPLDGTKEFVKRNGEFTINIALIDKFSPVLGVVYAPCMSKIYFAARGMGAFLKIANIEDKEILKESNVKLKINESKKYDDILKIICSRSHKNSKKMKEWLNTQNKYDLSYSGSSIKFCLIAEGKADIYPRFKPTSEWDIAAGHCILNEAGGSVKDLDGNEIKYNKKESLINPDFIASRN